MSHWLLWALAALASAMLAIVFALLGLSLDVSNGAGQVLMVVTAVPLAAYRARLSDVRLTRLIDGFEALTLFSLIATLGCLASYAVAAVTVGFVDDALVAVDRSLGFDWLALYRLAIANQAASSVARVAYTSIFVSPTIILTWLAWSGRMARARTFLLAFAIALTITVALFGLFPARSALAQHVGTDPAYLPVSALWHIGVIEGLRSGALTTIDIGTLHGLITFPSFHATSAILFIWAAWSVRALRWPMTAINVAMIAATPIEGTHYLIDVLGGLLVAALALGIVTLPRFGIRASRVQPFRANAVARRPT